MPELPEVETVMRGLTPVLVGRTLTSLTARRADLRWPLPKNMEKQLVGQPITALERRAKYILIHFQHGLSLLVHLGMSGRMVIDDGKTALEKHDHVILKTDAGMRVRFNDARRFGMMDIMETETARQHKLLVHLGHEPLSRSFTAKSLLAAIQTRKTAIKTAIMDQEVVVGVGNIYASEALFMAGIHPKRSASTVKQAEAEKLVEAIKKVLKRAIEKGGSTLRDYVQADGELGYFQHEFAVYGRKGEPCKNCKKPLEHMTIGARSTFFCVNCQK